MNYIVNPNQIQKIIRSYYGPLEKKVAYRTTMWQNSDGETVFIFFNTSNGYSKMIVKLKPYNALLDFLGFEPKSQNSVIVWQSLMVYLKELVDTEIREFGITEY